MTKITFNLPLFNPLSQGPLRLRQHAVLVELRLIAGEQLFTSTPMEIGNFFHFKVYVHITIPYSYDSDMQYVTICGSEDTSNKQLAIHISLEQHPKLTSSHRLNSTGVTAVAPNMWTDFIDNAPVVKQVIQTAIRGAIGALVVQLLDAGVQGVIQTGSAPIVNPHNYQDYKAMFAPEKADVEQPSLDDLFEIQEIVNSTYDGTITWPENYAFANVIDSTGDPYPPGYNAWIRLWADKCHGGYTTTKCSSYNYQNGSPTFKCNPSGFLGGHVIPGKQAQKVTKGKDVYIFPICSGHNNNDNIYMSSRYNPEGVKLKYRG